MERTVFLIKGSFKDINFEFLNELAIVLIIEFNPRADQLSTCCVETLITFAVLVSRNLAT